MDIEAIALLVDPADHQNVPKAVRLLQSITALGDLPSKHLNPTEQKANQMLTLLGRIHHFLVDPFFNVHLTLKEQMTSLATYAHLSFAMFKMHGTSFSSNQLYADCQSMIKNAFFCVAKQQCMNSKLPIFLSQFGDDRLEVHFSEVRCGTHQRNVDVSELTQKSAAAMDRHEVFSRHRDWDRGHRRLNFSDGIAVDHVNPRSWKGDVTSGGVCLESAWKDGREIAETTLAAAGIKIDFLALFDKEGLDMLRPNGDGKYPAVATDKDRSIAEEVVGANTTDSPPSQNDTNLDGNSAMEDDVPIQLDDLLPEIDAEDPEEQEESGWITIKGVTEKVHKATLLKVGIDIRRNRDGKKSADRNKRVQGVRTYTRHGHEVNLDSNDIFGNSFTHGGLAATLVKSGSSLCLAILSATTLEIKGNKVSQIDLGEMELASANTKVTGQIQVLRAVSPGVWVWTGDYASLPPVKALSGAAALNSKAHQFIRKTMTVTVPGHLLQPLSPDSCFTKDIPGWDNLSEAEVRSDRTWTYSEESLSLLVDGIWGSAQAADAASSVAFFPKCGANSSIPYRNKSGEPYVLNS